MASIINLIILCEHHSVQLRLSNKSQRLNMLHLFLYLTFITHNTIKHINFCDWFKITIPEDHTSILRTTGKTIFRCVNSKHSPLNSEKLANQLKNCQKLYITTYKKIPRVLEHFQQDYFSPIYKYPRSMCQHMLHHWSQMPDIALSEFPHPCQICLH